MRRFKVYYDDGTVYEGDGSDESAWAAPQIGVQVVVYADDATAAGYRKVFPKGFKAYWCWRGGEWLLSDDAGYWDYMMYLPGPKKVLFGRHMVDSTEFWNLIGEAKL